MLTTCAHWQILTKLSTTHVHETNSSVQHTLLRGIPDLPENLAVTTKLLVLRIKKAGRFNL